MRQALQLIRTCEAGQRCAKWHAAYLEDRIALYEGRPQRFGTQWIDDPRDGIPRPWTLADSDPVNERRASVGHKSLPPISPPEPDLRGDKPRENEADQKWWRDWLALRGGHRAP